ncbi:unnamed protein product [Cylindrotheca closterium]|uniref:Gem-associated protein 2 n=1 Tax=Cylindrotheca closterium TaxID=2856 RepID=A0AAD2GC15_9STRA|nr:unnamed protein product [Cylindrotheca closterium]
MSQPCLPIPRNHPNRKRRRHNSSKEDAASNDSTPAATFDNIETMDATEYLFRVVQQAKGLPEIFVAGEDNENFKNAPAFDPDFVPIDGSAASLSYLLSKRTQLLPPPSIHHLPQDCNRWMDKSIANFESLRRYLSTCKEEGIGGKKTKRLAFPAMKDQDGWLAFCLGRNWNGQGQSDVNDATSSNMVDNETTASESTATENSIPLWKRDIPEKGHDPWVRIVLQIDQVLLRRVLSHVGHFLCNDLDDEDDDKKDAARHSHALKWMYSLLARLDFPIHRDDASVLYQLLKALTRARSCLVLPPPAETNTTNTTNTPSTSNNSEELRTRLAQWNLLIVVIGVFFEQGGAAANLMTCV